MDLSDLSINFLRNEYAGDEKIIVNLMIKQHKTTDLKYFCRTTSQDPYAYTGSGTYWKNHLKKYGFDFSTKIVIRMYENDPMLSKIALSFSSLNNIVKSKEWANLIPEDGLNGWGSGKSNPTHFMTPEQHKAKGKAFKGKKRPDHGIAMSGDKNPMFGKSNHTHGLKKLGKERAGKSNIEYYGPIASYLMSNKMSNSNKNTKHKLIEKTCPFCFLKGSGPNMSRYHFDNCKLNLTNIKNKIGTYSIWPKNDNRHKIFKCKWCHKDIKNIGNYNRWHGDKCKKRTNK